MGKLGARELNFSSDVDLVFLTSVTGVGAPSVRLSYAGVEHQLEPDPLTAIRRCPPGRVEVLANYTAFRDLGRAIAAVGPRTGAGADRKEQQR